MIITLDNGKQVEIKAINLSGGFIDYRRVNDPVYSGDCILYMQITDIENAEAEIKTVLEATEAETMAAAEASRVSILQTANSGVLKELKYNRLLQRGEIAKALKL